MAPGHGQKARGVELKSARAYTNVFRMRLNYLLRRRVIDHYPVDAYIDPAQLCNLRCPECPTGLRLKMRPPASMDVKLLKALLDEVGEYLFDLYLYNWGEPLLHKQILEMIALGKSRGICVTISSNLSVELSDEFIRRLVDTGLDKLIVSLDGACQETYERYRRGGDFELVCRNMRRLAQAKAAAGSSKPQVVLQFLVFRHNEHEIPQISSLYKSLGADRVNFSSPVMPRDPERLGIQPSTLPKYNLCHRRNGIWKKMWKKAASNRKPCSLLYTTAAVDSKGNLAACCAVAAEKDAFGTLNGSEKLLDVWNNEKFRRARSLPGNSFMKTTIQGRDRAEALAISAAEAVGPDEIICMYCPQPWMQRTRSPVPRGIVDHLLDALVDGESIKQRAKALAFYLLMGAPHLGHCITRLRRKLVRKLWSRLTGAGRGAAGHAVLGRSS